MLNLLKDKSKRDLCALCKEKIDRNRCYVLLEIKIVPPVLLFFHVSHFSDMIETLSEYVRERKTEVFEEFTRLDLGKVREERRWAEKLGIEGEFRKDINEVMTVKLYDELITTLEKKIVCGLFRERKTFGDCLRCANHGVFHQCDKTLFFSIKPHLEKYRRVLREI